MLTEYKKGNLSVDSIMSINHEFEMITKSLVERNIISVFESCLLFVAYIFTKPTKKSKVNLVNALI